MSRCRRGRQGSRTERGAILVEFALVTPILVMLVLGVLEIGSAWSEYQSLNQASRAGARVVSQMGLQGEADAQTLLAVDAALGSLGDNVSRIVIYEADVDGAMPAACESATVGYSGGANCNVYDATSLANISTPGWWGSGTSCGSADGNWCAPTEREDELIAATYIGVQVEVDRSYLTGLFGGGTHKISESTVMRVEPEIE